MAAAAVLGLAYLAARETPLFAVDRVDVRGAPPEVEEEVRLAAEPFVGESLVGLDGEELRRRLESLPAVRSFRYDRAFPSTLAITVVPEEPAAVLRRRGDGWLVSERGRVIAAVERGQFRELPRIRVHDEAPPTPGAAVAGADAKQALAAVARLPANFPVEVQAARTNPEGITLRLAGGTELRLGTFDSVGLKLAVAAQILRTLPAGERQTLAYLDVSVPERPVGSAEAQVSG